MSCDLSVHNVWKHGPFKLFDPGIPKSYLEIHKIKGKPTFETNFAHYQVTQKYIFPQFCGQL